MSDLKRFLGLNRFKNSSLIKRNENLGRIRRGKEILFIERETASWIVLSEAELRFFNSLNSPATVGELKMSSPGGLESSEIEGLLLRLFMRNMITLNGSAFYNPEELWKTPQKYPAFLCFHITGACNFACKYCYARADEAHQEQKKMPKEVAHRAIEKILEEIPIDKYLIDFHGGEPFMAYDEMVDTIQYAREYNKKRGLNKTLNFCAQSNASLVTVEKAGFLKSIDCNVGISIDGPRHVHDVNRIWPDGSGTFDRAWSNVCGMINNGIGTGLLAVIHDPVNYSEVFEYFVSKKMKCFRMNYSGYIGRAVEELEFPHGRGETFAKHYLKMVDRAIEYVLTTGQTLQVRDLDSQIHNIVSKFRPFMCYRSPCGCGNSILGFGRDGGIYACEEATGVEEFKIGSVFGDLTIPEILETSPVLKKINSRTVENIPRCRECMFKRFCGGRCTTKSFARFGNFEREDPMCRFYQIVYPELIWRIHDNPEIVPLLSPEAPIHDDFAGEYNIRPDGNKGENNGNNLPLC